ncbi:hypothetical protein R2R35_22660 [Anaerocolumna sp. AGMB13020]|uniref:hypothetical protein n=1 Tax=Anaerocolumna sp. AGMB13020 TaxID=3081750 RepID=UPI002952DA15|nr:hypothetical protein [Anaerocolumna sp. AGMB13020]WOO36560.1 hypothetical protein R2R35_22660 [Anaerocolumna sp. AGMB13020]
MPITPIEVVTMAPKSQEVSGYKHQESQKPINDQIVIHNKINSEIKHNSQQPVKASKGENKEYRYDAKEKGNNSFFGSKSKKQKKEESKEETKKTRSGSIDIRI